MKQMVQPNGYKTGKNLQRKSKENPKLNECITWFEWKYKDRELTSSDKSSIATILRYNSEE